MTKNTDKFNLRYMPEDEAVAIFKAWRRGEELEVYKGDGIWRRIESSVHTLRLSDIYRIPISPPSFNNWHLLPDWARFIAQGQNGGVFIFENEPDKAKKFWLTVDGEAMEITGFRIGYDPGTCGWENSMIEKPEGL